eukprot:m.1488088 g.1488088  ORF g.1488088 m.1488088 type:complete len:1281 (+) comp25186_c0_seq5:350-4192(+)
MTHMTLKQVVGTTDMVLLSEITEDAINKNLEKRFDAGDIYTYIGNVVISVNPYRSLKIYEPSTMDMYYGCNQFEFPPHIYALAENAMRSLTEHNLNQCIIISGESGAGKTEASKVIMQYIAHVCGKGDEVAKIRDMLLKCNPVLEAFGNAKTTRNDNSSRFGKYMDMQFDFKGDPQGGVITEYLLEKSRVSHQAQDERNFHIFYQLLRGAEANQLSALYLEENPSLYGFLNQSGCDTIDTMDDVFAWEETLEALKVVQFDNDDTNNVWKLLATILHMSNLKFSEQTNRGLPGSTLTSEARELCDLLGCSREDLERTLTTRVIKTGRDAVETDVSMEDAMSAVRGMCKTIYQRLFSWVVKRVNQSIAISGRAQRKSIGVLDIYGFEIFQDNSFEQFIINYCNEKLQQIFIELTLRMEQDEYVREGIPWEEINYFDNKIICDLIEGRNGILALVDDHCLRPGDDVTDAMLLDALNRHPPVCSHDHYLSRTKKKSLSDRSMNQQNFRLRHYAGDVTYSISGFLQKNKDTLWADIPRFLYKCEGVKILKTMFKNEGRSTGTGRRAVTLGSQFRSSIAALMENLSSKNPHYIRCIKPNSKKKAKVYESDLVLHQIKYLGLLENVRVRRAGYAFRMEYSSFVDRYKMCGNVTWPVWKGVPRDGAKFILTACKFPPEEYAWGRSKLFIRNPITLFKLEEIRKQRCIELATKIQAIWRGFQCKKVFKEQRRAVTLIAAFVRGRRDRKRYLAKREGALLVTAYYRMWRERRTFEEHQTKLLMSKAAIIITAAAKGFLVRKKYRRCFRVHAGPVLVRNLIVYQRRHWLRELAGKLPTVEPNKGCSMQSPANFSTARQQAETMFHACRCKMYRDACPPARQAVLREKYIASQLFKGKKLSYPASVGQPFVGDHVGLQSPEISGKWMKIANLTGHGGNSDTVLVADNVTKVNRSNASTAERILVLTNDVVILCDSKYRLKFVIDLQNVVGVSMSSQGDATIVVHVNQAQSKGQNKGDHVFICESYVEFVTRLFVAHRKKSQQDLPINISDEFDVQFTRQHKVCFGHAEVEAVTVTKKGRGLTVSMPQSVHASADAKGRQLRGGSIRRPNVRLMSDESMDLSAANGFRSNSLSAIGTAAAAPQPSSSNGTDDTVRTPESRKAQSISSPRNADALQARANAVNTFQQSQQSNRAQTVSTSQPAASTSNTSRGGSRGGRGRGSRGRGSRGRGGRGRGSASPSDATSPQPSAGVPSSPTVSDSGSGGRGSGRGSRLGGSGRGGLATRRRCAGSSQH